MKRKAYILVVVLYIILSSLVKTSAQNYIHICKGENEFYSFGLDIKKMVNKEDARFDWDILFEGGSVLGDAGEIYAGDSAHTVKTKWEAGGEYELYVQTHYYYNRNCYDDTSFIVRVFVSPDIDIEDTSICEGSTAILSVKNKEIFDKNTIKWRINELDNIDVEQKDLYSVLGDMVKYGEEIGLSVFGTKTSKVNGEINSCVVQKDIDVLINPLPEINLGADTMLCEDGLDIRIKDLNQDATWTYSSQINDKKVKTQANVIMISPQYYEQYLIADVVDINQCENSDTLKVLPCTEVEEIKTVFTPNGDGANDKWIIPFLRFYPDCKVEIFDRWGRTVFSSSGYDDTKAWDGRSNGKLLPMDSYYYVIDLNNGDAPLTGHVTIIR